MSIPEQDTEDCGWEVYSVESLMEMLGWNSVAVFYSGKHVDGESLYVTSADVALMLTDPYPEYKEFVFDDGELQHESDLLTMEYEGVMRDYYDMYGKPVLYPLSIVEGVERDEHNIPQYVGDN